VVKPRTLRVIDFVITELNLSG